MRGAKEIYDYLPQGVCGRLFIDKGDYTRGKTLRIYVLPIGDWEGVNSLIINDVKRIIKDNKERIKRENEYYNKVATEREKAEKERINKLLSDY